MGNISKLPKDRMIRPSVIGAVDKINEIIDDVNETDDNLATLTDKVEGLIVEGGEPNVIESVSLNGEPLPVVDKNVDVSTITTKTTTGPAYGPLISVTAKGHAEQDRISGLNLLPATLAELKARNTSGTWADSAYSINGITFVRNPDGSITANGTASADALMILSSSATNGLRDTLQGKSLVLSGCPKTGSASTYRMLAYNMTGNSATSPETGSGLSFVFNNTSAGFNFALAVVSGYTASNLTFYPQLEVGTIATPYEPYTGGIPSPNPDYPQEIRVVRGRNLFTNLATFSVGGLTATVLDDGRVRVTGTQTAANVICPVIADKPLDLVAGETYTMTSIGAGSIGYIALFGTDDKSNFTNLVDTSSGDTRTTTFTLNKEYKYYRLNVCGKPNASGTTYDATVSIQLELGSTVHPYVPYGYIGLDVTADGTTTTTPIPLPSRGWVGSLPDGTHDALSIDGAGNVTWELMDTEVVLNANASESWQYESTSNGFRLNNMTAEFAAVENHSVNLYASHFQPHVWDRLTDGTIQFSGHRPLFIHSGIEQTTAAWTAWLQANPVTVFYPLATPTTVEVGHVDLPDIPDGAVVSIPELEGLGVESWTSDVVARYVRAWVARLSTPSVIFPAGE